MGAKSKLATAKTATIAPLPGGLRPDAESQLRAIIDATPECVKVLDPEGRVLEMNPAGLRMIDCEHLQDISGHELVGMIVPEDRDAWMRNHRRVCSGESLRWAFSGITPKGRKIHLETNAVPVLGPDGRLCHLAVTRDITEQRAHLSALAASERSLSQAIKATGLGIVTHDHRSGDTTVNREMRKIACLPDNEKPTLRYYLEMVPHQDRKACIAALRASRDPRGSGAMRLDHAIVTPEGQRRWLEIDAQTTFVLEGTRRVPECTIAAVRDVTLAHQALDDVSEAESKWRNLFTSMQEGFIIGEIREPAIGQRADVEIMEANNQWEAMTGIPIQNVLGMTLRAAIPGIEEFWYETFSDVVRTGEPATCERYVEPLGRWFEVRVYRHSPGRFAAVFLNITERKLAQAALHEAEQEQFRLSRLNAMGAMASTLAHELNQPLATSANYLNAMLAQLDGRRIDGSALRQAARDALAACLRAGDIIRRTRSFTMEGQVLCQRENLKSIIEDAVADIRRQPMAAGVSIGLQIRNELFAECDRVQLEQVFGNLLRNAVQALAEAPQKHIDVRATCRGSRAIVRVEDTGPGLNKEIAAQLFNPFRTTKQEGLGLGLALCRTIIEAHEGTIHGANRPQGGAVFEVRLPAAP